MGVDLDDVLSTARIGAFDGILIGTHSLVEKDGEERIEVRNDIYAAVVLPSLQVIAVHQSGGDKIGLLDQAIVQQVGSAVQMADTGEPEAANVVITLPPGIEL